MANLPGVVLILSLGGVIFLQPAPSSSALGQQSTGATTSTTASTATTGSTATSPPSTTAGTPPAPAVAPSPGPTYLVPANSRDYVVSHWPITFVSRPLPGFITSTPPSGGAAPATPPPGTLQVLSTSLSGIFSDVQVQPAGNGLIIAGPSDHVRFIKTILAKWIDVPYPQVTVNVMAFQSTSRLYQDEAADAVEMAEAGIKLAREFIRAYTLDVAGFVARPTRSPQDFFKYYPAHDDDVKKLFFRFKLLGTKDLNSEDPEELDQGRMHIKPFVEDLAYLALCDPLQFAPNGQFDNFINTQGVSRKLLGSFVSQLNNQLAGIAKARNAGTITSEQATRGCKEANYLLKLCAAIEQSAFPAYRMFSGLLCNTATSETSRSLLQFLREYSRPTSFLDVNKLDELKKARDFDTLSRDELHAKLTALEKQLDNAAILKADAFERSRRLYEGVYSVALPVAETVPVLQLQVEIADDQSFISQKQARLTIVQTAISTSKSGSNTLSNKTLEGLVAEEHKLQIEIESTKHRVRVRSLELAKFGVQAPPLPASAASPQNSSSPTTTTTTTLSLPVPPSTGKNAGPAATQKPAAQKSSKGATKSAKPPAKKSGTSSKSSSTTQGSGSNQKATSTATPLFTVSTATTTPGSSQAAPAASASGSSATPNAGGTNAASTTPGTTASSTTGGSTTAPATGGQGQPSTQTPTLPTTSLRAELTNVVADLAALQTQEDTLRANRDALRLQFDAARQAVVADQNAVNGFNFYGSTDHTPVDPEDLARMGSNLDELIKNATDAISGDIDQGVITPLNDWIREYSRGQRTGLVMTGELSLAVTSTQGAVATGSATFYSPYTPQQNLSTSQLATLLGTSVGASFFSSQGVASLLQTLTGLSGGSAPYTPVYTTIAPGLDLAVLPSVLPGARAARLQIDFRSGNTVTPPAAGATSTTPPNVPPINTVNTHEVRTDVAVNAFDLFPLSTFSSDATTIGEPQWRIYGLEGLPIFGNMFIGPRRPVTSTGRSLLIVYTTIMPRSLDLAQRYSSAN